MERIAEENTDAPASVARAHAVADFLRYLAERMPQLAVQWREERERAAGEAEAGAPDERRAGAGRRAADG
jgi:hypothetical protein